MDRRTRQPSGALRGRGRGVVRSGPRPALYSPSLPRGRVLGDSRSHAAPLRMRKVTVSAGPHHSRIRKAESYPNRGSCPVLPGDPRTTVEDTGRTRRDVGSSPRETGSAFTPSWSCVWGGWPIGIMGSVVPASHLRRLWERWAALPTGIVGDVVLWRGALR